MYIIKQTSGFITKRQNIFSSPRHKDLNEKLVNLKNIISNLIVISL